MAKTENLHNNERFRYRRAPMKESITSLPHIMSCVPLTAEINILHTLTISVRDENGDHKLLQPSSLLLHFQKSFLNQNVRKKCVLYYPRGRFSSGGSEKVFFYRYYLMRKENNIFPLLPEMCREKIKTFFLPNFESVTFALWKWCVKLTWFAQNAAW